MSSETPIGLTRLRGGSAAVSEPSVMGWEAFATSSKPAAKPAATLGSMSLVSAPASSSSSASSALPSPQVSPVDKGEAMALMLELSQLLLQEGDAAHRRQGWLRIRQQLDHLLR